MNPLAIVPGLAERSRVKTHTPTCACQACLGTLGWLRVQQAIEDERTRPVEGK